jgi:hypothetical protein
MKRSRESQNFRATRRTAEAARQFDEPLIGFCPAVAKENLSSACEINQSLCEIRLGSCAIEIRCVDKFCSLITNGRSDLRVSVTERTHSNARAKVQILLV